MTGYTQNDHYTDYFSEAECQVRVIDAERTFWEKATILHAHWHGGPEKASKGALARHYYDVYMCAQAGVAERTLADFSLLARVVKHKSVYFARAWARYAEAQPGTLRLAPGPDIANILKKDYDQMTRDQYFYGEAPPSFEEIVSELSLLEARINDTH